MLNIKNDFQFTFENIKRYFQNALDKNYVILSCYDYFQYKKSKKKHERVLVNRVDIDISVKKAYRLALIFNQLNIKATFFLRLHANEYNPFSFENYRILKFIKESGHEIGYHSEVEDEAVIWNESSVKCLKRDLIVLRKMLGIDIFGVASHGGMTGLNNLDFWKNKSPASFGLLYEAYDSLPEFNLFYDAIYVTDSCWTYWKCYCQGKLVDKDRRSLDEHINAKHPLIYSLIHPETYYDGHIYE